MSEQRHVRFATLGELTRDELQLAVEVWFEDAMKAPWASKETMKLAGVLRLYMMSPDADGLNLKTIEDFYQLSADAARRALVLYTLYGMVEAHSTDNNQLRAALRLSRLQTLRVLEARQRLAELSRTSGHDARATPNHKVEPAWLPESPNDERPQEQSHAGSEQPRQSSAHHSDVAQAMASAAGSDSIDAPRHAASEQIPATPDRAALARPADGETDEPELSDRHEDVTVEVTDAVRRPRNICRATETASPPSGASRLSQRMPEPGDDSRTAPPNETLSGQAALARSLARLRQRA